MEHQTQPMSIAEVSNLMLSSLTEHQWNQNCDKVKAAFNGQYPEWWYKEIVLSGLMGFVTSTFNR